MVEVSKSKSINKYLESGNISAIEEKATFSWLVREEYFFVSPGTHQLLEGNFKASQILSRLVKC